MKNSYSRIWFELFLETRPYTEQEASFVTRNLPNPPYRKILDLGCGEGRHTNILAQNGYEMTGLDIDAEALVIAAEASAGKVAYIQQDMRELQALPEQFDAILSLWQSFGYFDEAINRNMMKQVAQKLVPGGRFVLDIYNRTFWEKNQGTQQLERNGVEIIVENKMIGNRLQAFLTYGNGLGSDLFEWQLYTLDEIIPLGKAFGLRSVLNCTAYDEAKPIGADKPMMQIIFEKKGVESIDR